ncbi:unknown [Brachyspira sp. CAG:484]|nr:unknown [Brachyspira sp. CAG:484]
MYSYNNSENPYMIERIVAALTYPTMGMIGFIWLILGLITKARPRAFTLYHIYQSIFLSIAYVVLSLLIGIVVNILSYVPLINKLVAQIVFWTNAPVFFGYSIIQTIIYAIILYLAVFAFMGRYSYFPWVSEIIKENLR